MHAFGALTFSGADTWHHEPQASLHFRVYSNGWLSLQPTSVPLDRTGMKQKHPSTVQRWGRTRTRPAALPH